MFIRQDIAAAHKAMIEGDLVGMMRAYDKLKGWQDSTELLGDAQWAY